MNENKGLPPGIARIDCSICGTVRLVEARQYPMGLPDICIKCSKVKPR